MSFETFISDCHDLVKTSAYLVTKTDSSGVISTWNAPPGLRIPEYLSSLHADCCTARYCKNGKVYVDVLDVGNQLIERHTHSM